MNLSVRMHYLLFIFFVFLIKKSITKSFTASKLGIYGQLATGETLDIRAWADDSLRIRIAPQEHQIIDNAPGALGPDPPLLLTQVFVSLEKFRVTNGALSCIIHQKTASISCHRTADGVNFFTAPLPIFKATRYTNVSAINFTTTLASNEQIWGLGQHQSGKLSNRNECFAMNPQNTEILIPILHSSKGYSYLFNSPSYGKICLDKPILNQISWQSMGVLQLDLWITASPPPTHTSPSPLIASMTRYHQVTGAAAPLPYWCTGFWQSKNRYRNQTEVLNIIREYKLRKIPLSVLVIDMGAWNLLGDECWGGCTVADDGISCSPRCWPDPRSMVTQAQEMGVEIMLSPYFNLIVRQSVNFAEAKEKAALAVSPESVKGTEPNKAVCIGYSGYNTSKSPREGCPHVPPDPYCGQGCLYDVFDDDSGQLMMKNALHTFYHKSGIKWWWLDCDEPCDYSGRISEGNRLMWGRGRFPDILAGGQYPAELNRQIFQAMKSEGEEYVVTLARSAWAGSQRYGVVVWSGDIDGTFASLSASVRAGINIGLSGISYWTTDIGGYQGGHLDDPLYQQLLVRWFQFGAFCGIFRVHGYRVPTLEPGICDAPKSLGMGPPGGPNEAWTYSPKTSEAVIKMIHLRELLRPYIMSLYKLYQQDSTPIMRPLFFDFPHDSNTYNESLSDQFMFGPDFLVAPIVKNCTPTTSCLSRQVYLPHLNNNSLIWQHFFTNKTYDSGQSYIISGPLDQFPLFKRVKHTLP